MEQVRIDEIVRDVYNVLMLSNLRRRRSPERYTANTSLVPVRFNRPARPSVEEIVQGTLHVIRYLQERGELLIYQLTNRIVSDNVYRLRGRYFQKYGNSEVMNGRYEIIRIIGRGSFGDVILAYDRPRKDYVAIKVTEKNEASLKTFIKEVTHLNIIKLHPHKACVIQMLDNFIHFDHPCIVFELLGNNLEFELKQTSNRGFDIYTVRELARSMLHGLRCLKEMNLVHSDIKPGNIAVVNKNNCQVKIIDFGKCAPHPQIHGSLEQTRYYRAPEIIFRMPYGCEIDLWSFGAIVAELSTGYILFNGSTEQDQLASIIEVIGLPETQFSLSSPVAFRHFRPNGLPNYLFYPNGKLRAHPQERKRLMPGVRSLELILANTNSKVFVDFIRSCLQWEPKDRLTPHEALNHPFMMGAL